MCGGKKWENDHKCVRRRLAPVRPLDSASRPYPGTSGTSAPPRQPDAEPLSHPGLGELWSLQEADSSSAAGVNPDEQPGGAAEDGPITAHGPITRANSTVITSSNAPPPPLLITGH